VHTAKYAMQKFHDWLNANRGMATRLHRKLGINATMISNAKHGRILIPTSWMQTIESMSKGKITIREMVISRNAASKRTSNSVQ
jgi:DNA-binding transcriptional regulator YdaS (Cro superfamily)